MSSFWKRIAYARATFVAGGLLLLLYRVVSGSSIGDDIPPAHIGLIVLAAIVSASVYASEQPA